MTTTTPPLATDAAAPAKDAAKPAAETEEVGRSGTR